MTNFTASDGKKYQTTGEFREATRDELWWPARNWGDWNLEPMQGNSREPAIIVTLVEPEYDVTVRLSESEFKAIRKTAVDWQGWLLHNAIAAGSYTEVTE